MDIRNFFGDKQGGKSALSEVRESKGSPVARGKLPTPKKRPESATKRKNLVVELSDSDKSDGEQPLPRSLRKTLAGASKKKKISWSSDDDDELPPSASQARPMKRNEKSPPAERSKPRRVRGPAVIAVDEVRSPLKRKAETSASKSSQQSVPEEVVVIEDEEDQDFMPSTSKRGRRQRTPPGQSKLSFQKGVKTTTSQPEKEKKGEKLKPVDPADYFKNFGKTGTEGKKEVSESKKHTKEAEEVKKKVTKKAEKNREDTSTAVKTSDKSPPQRDANGAGVKKKDSPEKSPYFKEKRKEKNAEAVVPKLPAKSLSSPKKADKVEPTKSFSSPGKGKDVRTKKEEVAQKRESDVRKVTAPQRKDDRPETVTARTPEKVSLSVPWVDKYKPTSVKQLVGQNGEKSPMNKLLGWLRDWPRYHRGEAAKVKKPRPAPWLAQSDGTSFKAVLLSGPPGVGKTTCAVMACNELGLNYTEMNASDSRNKKLLEVKVAEGVDSRQVDEFFGKGASSRQPKRSNELTHVLIMDEVDGMSGNEDRAGLAELIQLIKDTRVPIICICNDRQSPKMRSLVNYCFDLRFQRPRVEQIRSRMQTIAFQEKLKLSKEEIDELIELSNHDVRQSIYNLQLLSAGGSCKNIQVKDCAVNTFEAARRLLSADSSILQKQEMFFTDYSLMPLFVHENYPNIRSKKSSEKETLSALRRASASIAQGDIVDRTIRTTGAWSLLNEQALFSSILPTMYMNGYMGSMINFPSWLGRNSTTNKRKRMMRQLAYHTHLKISADCSSLVTDYVPVLRDCMVRPLVNDQSDGVPEVVEVYDEYDLTREDSDAIAELGVWPEMEDLGTKIQTKVKAALTRALNKEHRHLPYALDEVTKGRKKATAAGGDLAMELDEEGNVVEVGGGEDALNDDDDAGSDEDDFASTSAKKTTTASSSTGRGRGRGGAAASSSAPAKRGGGGRGRGRGRGGKA